MTLIEYRSYFRLKLEFIYKVEESDDLLKRIIKAYFNWEPIKIGLEPNYVLSQKEEERLNLALNELKKETSSVHSGKLFIHGSGVSSQ